MADPASNYVIGKEIGRGSYACVYIVTEKSTGQRYVMKRVDLKQLSPKDVASSKQEVDLLRKLNHPYIVSYKDSFIDNKTRTLCIVMTYCDGGDLATLIKNAQGKSFPEDQVLTWFTQIALAMQYIHARKILHRDLKTQNIFLMRDGSVKIGDFGIARVLDSTLAMAHTAIGTPLYLSPEVCQNKPYSYKSDVWAMGCVLYELATLKHAFDAQNLNGLVMKIIRGTYPPIPAQYSSKLSDWIKRMLNKSPSQRPTMDEIVRSPFFRRVYPANPGPSLQAQLESLGIGGSSSVTPTTSAPSSARDQASVMSNRPDNASMPSAAGVAHAPYGVNPAVAGKAPEVERAMEELRNERKRQEEVQAALARLKSEQAARLQMVQQRKRRVDDRVSAEKNRANEMEARSRERQKRAEELRQQNLQKVKDRARAPGQGAPAPNVPSLVGKAVPAAPPSQGVQPSAQIQPYAVQRPSAPVPSGQPRPTVQEMERMEQEVARMKMAEKERQESERKRQQLEAQRQERERQEKEKQQQLLLLQQQEKERAIAKQREADLQKEREKRERERIESLPAKERVLLQKQLRKEEEEAKLRADLAKAGQAYFQERLRADAKTKAEYQGSAFPVASGSKAQLLSQPSSVPSSAVPAPSQKPESSSGDDRRDFGGDDLGDMESDDGSSLNGASDDEQATSMIAQYEQELQQRTLRIAELEQSLRQARGASVESQGLPDVGGSDDEYENDDAYPVINDDDADDDDEYYEDNFDDDEVYAAPDDDPVPHVPVASRASEYRSSAAIAPPQSKVEKKKGSLHDRAEMLRRHCIEGLGEPLFHRAHSLILSLHEQSDLPEEVVVRQVEALLGKDRLRYWQFIDQLVFVENLL